MSENLALPRIAARIFNTPLLIAQRKLDAILQAIGPRLESMDAEPSGEGEALERIDAERYEARLASIAPMGKRVERREQGHYVIGDVAIVPVIGSLVQRSSWLDAYSGLVSYGRIESMMAAAAADPMVREILVEIDSWGGEASGAFDAADRMRAMRDAKRVTAVATEVATSGAYLLASSAHDIVVPRTGFVGSIGVVSAHFDHSRAMEKRGVAVTYIYAGDRKIDGSPYHPLTEEARRDWQQKIDATYALFVDTIARHRDMDPERVRETQAAIYQGAQALEAGLASRVASFEQELSEAVSRQAGPFRLNAQPQETSMSDKANGGATITAEDVTAARTEGHAAGLAEGKAGIAPAIAAERARIKGIMTSPEAEGRAELAAHLAFESDMAPEAATALMAKSPKAKAESPLDAAMRKETAANPGVSNQPAAPAKVVSIDHGEIYKRRAEAAKK